MLHLRIDSLTTRPLNEDYCKDNSPESYCNVAATTAQAYLCTIPPPADATIGKVELFLRVISDFRFLVWTRW